MNEYNNTYLMQLANFYSDLKFDSIPENVVEKARRALVDFLCEVALGFHIGQLTKIYNRYIKDIGGREEATILCENVKVPSINAATAMGIMGHAAELDDGFRWGTAHPAVAIIPSVLALGEKTNASYADILKSIIIGYDVMLRFARAINPVHLRNGFHTTGTCGSIGAAAGCASLLNLPVNQFAYAMSLGALQSAGLQEMLHDHQWIKPIQPGKSAQAGVLSAELVLKGAKSPRTIFEGQHGWLKAMCNGLYSEDAIIGDLGLRWEILFTYTKLYPTCRHCHAAIDLAIEAKDTLRITDLDVKSIEIKTYELGFVEVGQIFKPKNVEEAMFSMPFSVVLALRNGNVNYQDFEKENFADKDLLRLANSMDIVIDKELDRLYPEQRGASLEVILIDGRRYFGKTLLAKGEPEKPINDLELINKFKNMLQSYYHEEFVSALWELCVNQQIENISYKSIVDLFRRFGTSD